MKRLRRMKHKGLFLSTCLLALGLTYAAPAYGPTQIHDLLAQLLGKLSPGAAVDRHAPGSDFGPLADQASAAGGQEPGSLTFRYDDLYAAAFGWHAQEDGVPLICETWTEAGACFEPGTGGAPGGFGSDFDPVVLLPEGRGGFFAGLPVATGAGNGGSGNGGSGNGGSGQGGDTAPSGPPDYAARDEHRPVEMAEPASGVLLFLGLAGLGFLMFGRNRGRRPRA